MKAPEDYPKKTQLKSLKQSADLLAGKNLISFDVDQSENTLVCATTDGEVLLFENGEKSTCFSQYGISQIKFIPDHGLKVLVTGSFGVDAWDLKDKAKMFTVSENGSCTSMSF